MAWSVPFLRGCEAAAMTTGSSFWEGAGGCGTITNSSSGLSPAGARSSRLASSAELRLYVMYMCLYAWLVWWCFCFWAAQRPARQQKQESRARAFQPLSVHNGDPIQEVPGWVDCSALDAGTVLSSPCKPSSALSSPLPASQAWGSLLVNSSQLDQESPECASFLSGLPRNATSLVFRGSPSPKTSLLASKHAETVCAFFLIILS